VADTPLPLHRSSVAPAEACAPGKWVLQGKPLHILLQIDRSFFAAPHKKCLKCTQQVLY